METSPEHRAALPGLAGGSSWYAKAPLVLLIAALPALHVLGSCARDSGDDAEPAPAATSDAGEAAAETTTTMEEATTTHPLPDGFAFVPPDGNPETLGEWNQVAVEDGRLVPLERVTAYTLSTPLFTDYAHKLRTVWLPDGASAALYDEEETFDFPVGTVITKTFYYPTPDGAADAAIGVRKAPEDPAALVDGLATSDVRLIETRVLVHRDDGWHAFPYVWNSDETEATLQRVGDIQQLALVDDVTGTETSYTYVVPDVNQCANCHATDHSSGSIQPIGPKARHLNMDVDLGAGDVSQLAEWIDRGLLTEAPAASEAPATADWTDESISIDDRARAYLDINCAHCHNHAGAADTSGLFLDASTAYGLELGICKTPIAAGSGTGGREYDIVPGDPLASILVYRMESTDPAEMMPELGRSLAHDEGVDLITEWIEGLPGQC